MQGGTSIVSVQGSVESVKVSSILLIISYEQDGGTTREAFSRGIRDKQAEDGLVC